MLEFGSTFSGVGGIDLGLKRAGMRCAWQAESDEWCAAVLAARFPGVACYTDVRAVANPEVAPPPGLSGAGRVDVLCGGFPCQDVSVAGKRAGLAGERSGLFHEFARIADAVRPTWLLIENVPGLLTSNSGRDFGVVLGTLAELGYGLAWRVLDSRYFGVPQRRRRVFVVGHSGGDDGPALRALCEGCGGSSQARETSWQAAAARTRNGAEADGSHYYVEDGINGTLKAGGAGGSPPRTDRLPLLTQAATLSSGSHPNSAIPGRRKEDDVNLIPQLAGRLEVAPTLQAHHRDGGGFGPEMPMTVSPVLTAHHKRLDGQDEAFVAYTLQPDDAGVAPGALRGSRIDTAPALDTTADRKKSERGVRVAAPAGVRRLTPRECERLQGFPDDWTLVDGMTCPDSRRYGAMGNAVTVNVAEWIGLGIVAEHARTDGKVGPSAAWG